MSDLRLEIGSVFPWPSIPERTQVLRHKSRLIQFGDWIGSLERPTNDALFRRALYSGAAQWEIWLLKRTDHDDVDPDRRVRSALSLSEAAGDWDLLGALFETCETIRIPQHKRSLRELRKKLIPPQGAAASLQALKDSFVRFSSAPDEVAAHDLRQRAASLDRIYGMPSAVQYALGRMYSILGDLRMAEQHLHAACIADPFKGGIAALLSEIVERRSPGEAAELLTYAMHTIGRPIEMLAVLAKAEWERWRDGKFLGPAPTNIADEIRRALGAHNADDPAGALGCLVAGYILERTEGVQAATKLVESCLKSRAADAGLLAYLGLLRLATGSQDECLRYLLRAQSSEIQIPMVSALIGTIYLERNQIPEAEQHLRIATGTARNEREKATCLNDLGVALARSGKREDAIEAFSKALLVLGDDIRVRHNLSLASEPRVPVSERADYASLTNGSVVREALVDVAA